jgi:predicted MFS family arabinose efflux permease
MLMVPARVAQAFAPLLFGLLLDHWGTASVAATALLGVACALALWWLKPPPHPPA